LAHGLLKRGCRRVADRSGWVKAPILYRVGSVGPTTTIAEEPTMWTKPEAEIVAVTMEVTAYVATL
jgi:coenzyme PQQ precursor peptide PqqA